MPEEVVLLTSDCEGFAGKQHVLSLPLLPGNVENEGENSRRNIVVLQTMRFHPWDVASLNSWEWMVFLTFQKHELNYKWWGVFGCFVYFRASSVGTSLSLQWDLLFQFSRGLELFELLETATKGYWQHLGDQVLILGCSPGPVQELPADCGVAQSQSPSCAYIPSVFGILVLRFVYLGRVIRQSEVTEKETR